jgi:hypothetical protein
MPQLLIYPLPSFLQDVMTARQYNRWLHKKAQMLFQRDRKRGMQYALKGSQALYKALINLAVVNGGGRDPYTNEKLAWELVGTWEGGKTKDPQNTPEVFENKYSLLPTIDHRDPDQLDFETHRPGKDNRIVFAR